MSRNLVIVDWMDGAKYRAKDLRVDLRFPFQQNNTKHTVRLYWDGLQQNHVIQMIQ